MRLTTPGLGEYISGAILYDETIRQSTKDGVPFTRVMMDNGIIPGIKVDKGPQPLAGFPGEVVTEGLDGLRERLKEYYQLGARFAKSSEEHTSELQSLMRISYAGYCLNKKTT